MIASVSGSTVRSCISAVRAKARLKYAESREVTRSGGEDGLYRSTLSDGTIVESTIVHRQSVGEIIFEC
jgi:hypothetical protein